MRGRRWDAPPLPATNITHNSQYVKLFMMGKIAKFPPHFLSLKTTEPSCACLFPAVFDGGILLVHK